MMRIPIAVLAGFLCAAGVANAQPSSPPAFKIVDGANKDKGVITFRETSVRYVAENRTVTKKENGIDVTRVITVKVPVFVQTLVEVDATKSRVITPDGKQLPIDEVWKRLKKDTVVVVSSDGNTPAQAFLRALNAETLVIIAPQTLVPPSPPVDVPPLEKKKE
jgi:hypothetical protein